MKKSLIVCLLCLLAFPVLAHRRTKMIPYVGLGVNNTKVRLSDVRKASFPNLKSNEPGGRAFLGLRFLRELIGIELGFEPISTFRLGNDQFTKSKQLRVSHTAVDLLGFVPLHQGIYMFGGVGLGHVRARFTEERSHSATRFRWRMGFEFAIDRYLNGRLVYTYQDSDQGTLGVRRLNQLGAAIIYRFYA